MNHQALDFDEVLQVKWACDDPNPIAITRNQMDEKMTLLEALKAQGVLKPTEVPQLEYLNDKVAAAPAPAQEEAKITTNPNQIEDEKKNSIQDQTFNYYYTYYYNYYLPMMGYNVEQAAIQAKQAADSFIEQQKQQNQPEEEEVQQKPVVVAPEKKEIVVEPKGDDKKDDDDDKEHKTDYYHYIHKSIRNFKVEEKKVQQEKQKLDEMRSQLESDVVDLYPNTDEQFNKQ